jgi:hypothetical protein
MFGGLMWQNDGASHRDAKPRAVALMSALADDRVRAAAASMATPLADAEALNEATFNPRGEHDDRRHLRSLAGRWPQGRVP